MIVAEGILIAAWMGVIATVWFMLKLFLRGSWFSTTLGILH